MKLIRISKLTSWLFLFLFLFLSKVLPSSSQDYLSKKNTTLRNSFPGRRVGGGTRASCDSSVIIHIVPLNSVFSPGYSGRLALIKGKSKNTIHAITKFSSYTSSGLNEKILAKKILEGSGGIYLIKAPYFKNKMIWESSLLCSNSQTNYSGLFGYDQTSPPPARTLLMKKATNIDTSLAENIKWLTKFCNSNVDIKDFSRRFPLDDVNSSLIDTKLNVNCDGLN